MLCGNQVVILTAEGNYPQFRLLSCDLADAIALQAGAVDQVASGNGAVRGLNDNLSGTAHYFHQLISRSHAPALRCDQLRILCAHRRIISNACAWYVDCAQAGTVWLDLAQLLRREHPQACDTIRQASLIQVIEPRQFLLSCSDDHLSANFVRNLVLAAELNHGRRAFYAETRLQRAWFVVNAGVNDYA